MIESIRAQLEANGLSALIITDLINLRYVTGLMISSGTLVISQGEAVLFVDKRYDLLAKTHCPYLRVETGSLERINESITALLRSIQGPIGFNGSSMSVDRYQGLLSQVPDVQLVSSSRFFAQLRRKKVPSEIERIERACQLCEKGFSFIVDNLRVGVTEEALSRAVKSFWFSQGADGIAFEPIIAFGANSASPHWSPSSTALKDNSVVLIDIGVQVQGYNSDMTRTFFWGQPDRELLKYYSIVHGAYALAEQLAKPGVAPIDLDKSVREYFAEHGCEDKFIHGLGHGVGLELHEAPRINSVFEHELPLIEGDVITIEPGLYIEGKGGIRIESTFVVEQDRARNLFSLPTELRVV